jgi:hypothetical protein
VSYPAIEKLQFGGELSMKRCFSVSGQHQFLPVAMGTAWVSFADFTGPLAWGEYPDPSMIQVFRIDPGKFQVKPTFPHSSEHGSSISTK